MDDLKKTMKEAVDARTEEDDELSVDEIIDICATEALVSMKLKLTALFPIFDSHKKALTMAKEFVRRWSEELTNQYGKINH